eukprot:6723680-Prorocentrum_lima.AAC.1
MRHLRTSRWERRPICCTTRTTGPSWGICWCSTGHRPWASASAARIRPGTARPVETGTTTAWRV